MDIFSRLDITDYLFIVSLIVFCIAISRIIRNNKNKNLSSNNADHENDMLIVVTKPSQVTKNNIKEYIQSDNSHQQTVDPPPAPPHDNSPLKTEIPPTEQSPETEFIRFYEIAESHF